MAREIAQPNFIFGFFFGKTPLIKLSPKKTWEGFIGGAVSTIIIGVAMARLVPMVRCRSPPRRTGGRGVVCSFVGERGERRKGKGERRESGERGKERK